MVRASNVSVPVRWFFWGVFLGGKKAAVGKVGRCVASLTVVSCAELVVHHGLDYPFDI